MNIRPGMRWLVCALCFGGLGGCGGDEGPPRTLGGFGEVTSAVVVVNPVINQGSTTSVQPGTVRADVSVKAGDLAAVRTDSSGLAMIEKLPTGAVPLRFDAGTITLQVVLPKELYDVVVAVRANAVEEILPAVRYAIGGQEVVLEPGASIAQAASADGTIVRLKAGEYPGGFELRAEGVLVFGAWSPKDGALSTITGDVNVLGGGIRMRGLKVTGTVTSNANNFSAAFCDLASAHITGNGVSLVRNRVTAGQATVPSSSAILVDNIGIP